MRQRLGRALALLQATPLPLDLVDNPARTGQWLISVGNLHQALIMLGGLDAARRGQAAESRGERLVRRFNRMINGLPLACLDGMSPVSKLGLLWPLLSDLEACFRYWASLPQMDTAPLLGLLQQYRHALGMMADRHVAPDPPAGLRPPRTVPAG